jgi:hypothetical protein
MQLSPSREVAGCESTQEISCTLWMPKVHYHFLKIPPLVPILSQINPVHTTPSYLSKIHYNIIHPPTSWSSVASLFRGFPPNNLYVFLVSPIRATDHAHIIAHDFTILIILAEEYKLRISSLYSFLQPHATSSLLGPNILLSTLFSNTLNPCSSRNFRDQVSHPFSCFLA